MRRERLDKFKNSPHRDSNPLDCHGVIYKVKSIYCSLMYLNIAFCKVPSVFTIFFLFKGKGSTHAYFVFKDTLSLWAHHKKTRPACREMYTPGLEYHRWQKWFRGYFAYECSWREPFLGEVKFSTA
jgi:hypothetical protein